MRRLADTGQAGSFSNRNRQRRFADFAALVDTVMGEGKQPVRIIDIGGTTRFWEQRGWAGWDAVRIVTVNIEPEPPEHENIEPTLGDATKLERFDDHSFDLVFSNSVIEHLETFEAQRAMAGEVRRLASRHWVQTPNFWFPIEPHFLTPAWHWLPEDVRVALLRRRRWGWRGPIPDAARARAAVREIRLLKRRELVELFPSSEIVAERFGGLTKSFVARRA